MKAQIMNDIKAAMKSKDKVALAALRALKTAMTNASIEKGNLETELTDAESMAVIRKQVKQRQDSIQQFEDNGRPELAESEKAEIKILNQYLPEPLTEAEVSALIEAAIAETGATSKKEMGQVMKLAQSKSEGRVDGKTLSQLIAKKLG